MERKDKVKKEEHLPCIEESLFDYKYDLERILKRYASAWKKLADYDKQKRGTYESKSTSNRSDTDNHRG